MLSRFAKWTLTVVAVMLAILPEIIRAAAPNLINYQGRLTSAAGNPVPNGTYSVNFTFYDAPVAGVPQWGETQSVTTTDGLFNVLLGSTIFFGSNLFEDSALFLAIKVGSDPEIFPRTRLTSVPYSLSSNNGWTVSGTNVHLRTDTNFVGIGTATPAHPLHVVDPRGGLFVSRIESSNTGATVTEISNTSSNSVWEASVAGSDGIPFWGIQPGDMYFYKQGTSWPNAVLTSGGSLGLGTSLPRARVEAVTLDTVAGLFLSAGATSATKVIRAEYTGTGNYEAVAVYGKSTPNPGFGYGGYFTGGWMGVRGISNDDGETDHMGVSGEAGGNGITAKVGVRGLATGSAGLKYGLYGDADGDGQNNGVYGEAGGNGQNTGVYGRATGASGTGRGVLGRCITNGSFSYGGEFEATGSANVNYGVYATATGGSTNFAGFFWGETWVVGTLTKSAGSFKIDHPLDPENRYLQHSFVESPDMMNIYNGNIVTDAAGNATITLPNWFEALNKDFRYQLTVIGQFAQAIVSSKISGNLFSIKTDKPNVEVSWQVTGIRRDAYAEAHRIEVETDKRPEERGKYSHPELFGKGRELSVGYQRELEHSTHTPANSISEEKLK